MKDYVKSPEIRKNIKRLINNYLLSKKYSKEAYNIEELVTSLSNLSSIQGGSKGSSCVRRRTGQKAKKTRRGVFKKRRRSKKRRR